MERKLVKQGRNALTVTLPAHWTKSNNLRAGDTVAIDERKGNIFITTERKKVSTTVTVDIRNLERSMAHHIIMGKYMQGYDCIEIIHDHSSFIHDFDNCYIGFITESASSKRVVLRDIVVVPEQNFTAVFRRTGHMLVQQSSSLIDVARGKKSLQELKQEEYLLDQHITYCIRYLNKHYTSQQSYKHLLLCAGFESAGDSISEIARVIDKDVALAKIIASGVEKYIAHVFMQDFKKVYSGLRVFRNNIDNKSFRHGLAFALAEQLYNYIGYLIDGEVNENLNPSSV